MQVKFFLKTYLIRACRWTKFSKKNKRAARLFSSTEYLLKLLSENYAFKKVCLQLQKIFQPIYAILFSFQASMFSLSEARILDNDANESNFMTVFNQLTRLNLDGREMPLLGIWILHRILCGLLSWKCLIFFGKLSRVEWTRCLCSYLSVKLRLIIPEFLIIPSIFNILSN